LSTLGYPDSHEYARQLALRARETGIDLPSLFWGDPDMKPYIDRLTPYQEYVLTDPARRYNGIAKKKALDVSAHWTEEMLLLKGRLAN
jgi:hypothetical protein